MTTAADRERARSADGRFGTQPNTRPEITLTTNRDVHTWGVWDDEGFWAIDVEEVGLRQLTPSEQAGITQRVTAWFDGDRALEDPSPVPIAQIQSTVQPILRRDALLWYTETLREHEDTFDDELSFYGADGPLGVELEDGTVAIVDGNHRFAAAKLRGDETFTMQVLRRPR